MKVVFYQRWILATFLTVLFSSHAHAQQLNIRKQIEALLRKTDTTTKVHINKASNYIEIEGTPKGKYYSLQIPYNYVTYTYRTIPSVNTEFINYIRIDCPNKEECIKEEQISISNGNSTDYSVSLPFISKEDAYKFLDLIDHLKKQK